VTHIKLKDGGCIREREWQIVNHSAKGGSESKRIEANLAGTKFVVHQFHSFNKIPNATEPGMDLDWI